MRHFLPGLLLLGILGATPAQAQEVHLKCLGAVKQGYLDGRPDGSVGLAPRTDGGFTGTRWEIQQQPGGDTYYLKCLGAVKQGYLDGRPDGSVGLAPRTDGGFTGTRWEISPVN